MVIALHQYVPEFGAGGTPTGWFIPINCKSKLVSIFSDLEYFCAAGRTNALGCRLPDSSF